MDQTELKRLLRKYLNGTCSDEEIKQVNIWFDSIPDPSLDLTESEKNELQQKIRENLPFLSVARSQKKAPVFTLMMQLGVAASIILFALASWFAYSSDGLIITDDKKFSSLSHLNVVENNERTEKVVVLSDGSSVILSPGSKIVFDKKFNSEMREVQLTGEAFFDVVKDPGRPFYVYSNNVTTKVLGTSFTVRAFDDNRTIEVAVKTGCVSVYNDKEEQRSDTLRTPPNKGVILTPNQKVVYFIKEDHWVTSLVEDPTPLQDLAPDELIFENTSMDEIVSQLEKQYGIEIVYENEQISKCTFTGDVSALPLFDILNVIGKSISAEYELRGSRILITGKGCH